jgi:hypothetical protein
MDDLEAVMAAYRALPTDQLVADSIVLTSDPETGPRLAGAAVFGFTRSGQYIDTARGLIDQIIANTEQISWHMSAYTVISDHIGKDYDASPLAMHELSKAVYHQQAAQTLSLRSEVHWHLYAECLDRAWYYMRNSTRYFDPDFNPNDVQQKYIETVRQFRNHMTHRDQAIRDINSPDWRSMSRNAEGWHEVGYKRDNRNRIEFSAVGGPYKGQTLKMPMSHEGFLQFKNIIKQTYGHLQRSCLRTLPLQFTRQPETMPRVDQVGTLMRHSVEPAEQ